METERPRVVSGQSPTRCPYCHESIDVEGEAWVACASCLARHHKECWFGHGRCATCQAARALKRMESVQERAPSLLSAAPGAPRIDRAVRLGLALGICSIGLLALVAWFQTLSPRTERTPTPAPTPPWESGSPAPAVATPGRKGTDPGDRLASPFLERIRKSSLTSLANMAGACERLPVLVARTVPAIVAVADGPVGLSNAPGPICFANLTLDTVTPVKASHAGVRVTCVDLVADGSCALVGEGWTNGRLWSHSLVLYSREKELQRIDLPLWADCVAFVSRGDQAVTGGFNGTLSLLDLKTGKAIRLLVGHVQQIVDVTASRDGRFVLSSSLDKSVKRWDLESPGELRTIELPDRFVKKVVVTSLALDSTGTRALLGSDVGTVALYDFATGKYVWTVEAAERNAISSVALSAQYAVTGGEDGKVRILDLEKGSELDRIDLASLEERPRKIRFAPDGRSLHVATARGLFLSFEIK
ncbi:hypothetical protein HY251_21580 [bacterium]|nr:hypothetical protein [bacterium]